MAHEATVAEEEYLQTIFWLQEAGLPMTGANVARAMQLSAPTVHEMIGRLEADGGTPEEFLALVRSETPKWAEVIRRSGAKVD